MRKLNFKWNVFIVAGFVVDKQINTTSGQFQQRRYHIKVPHFLSMT
jgi:hypothetical protein